MKTEKELILDFLSFHKKVDRVEALTTILKEQGIEYTIESYQDDCRNVIVSMTEEENYILLVAHHDLFPGSSGINDNTASVAALINVIGYLKDKAHLPFKVLFPDREETGMVGSDTYCYYHQDEIISAIVLDIIGYGDTLVAGSKINNYFSFLEKYGIINIDTILPSDNLAFNRYGIPNTLIVATHEEDILRKENKVELTPHPKFYESFHNRAMDGKIEVINFELITHLRNSLINILEIDEWTMRL